MHADPPKSTVPPTVFGLLWALVGAITCTSMIGLEPNLVEEGLVVHFAQRMLDGERLYRDLVFYTGPLPFELLRWLFKLFGQEIVVARFAAAVFHGSACAAAYGIARHGRSESIAHVAAAVVAVAPVVFFPFFSIYYYTPLAFDFALLAAYATTRAIAAPAWAFAAGFSVGCAALCKQSIGAALAISLFVALAANSERTLRRRSLPAYSFGGIAITALTLAVYSSRGDLAEIWRCLVTLPLALDESFRSSYMNLWPLGQLDDSIRASKLLYLPNLYSLQHGIFAHVSTRLIIAIQATYALPLFAIAATLVARSLRPISSAAWVNAALLVALSTNLFPRADWGHLVYVLPIGILQVLLLIAPARRSDGWLPPITAFLALVAISGGTITLGTWIHEQSGPPLWGKRVPQRPVSAIHRVITFPRVIRYLEARLEPDEEIFVARSEPLLYFATGAKNPTPYPGVIPGLRAEQERNILDALARIRFVVISDLDQPMWTYYSEELPRVQAYLERHYHVADQYPLDDASWVVVIERGEDRGETWLDLIEERATAKAWILDRDKQRVVDLRSPPRLVARQNRRPLATHLGPWGGGLDYSITVPENARFESAVGYRGMIAEDTIHEHPRRCDMLVEVGVGDRFEEVARLRVDDSKSGGRRWLPIEADLSAYAGQAITLRLRLDPRVRTDGHELSWWASPRIVVDHTTPKLP